MGPSIRQRIERAVLVIVSSNSSLLSTILYILTTTDLGATYWMVKKIASHRSLRDWSVRLLFYRAKISIGPCIVYEELKVFLRETKMRSGREFFFSIRTADFGLHSHDYRPGRHLLDGKKNSLAQILTRLVCPLAFLSRENIV